MACQRRVLDYWTSRRRGALVAIALPAARNHLGKGSA
jgi:hypothetical protein